MTIHNKQIGTFIYYIKVLKYRPIIGMVRNKLITAFRAQLLMVACMHDGINED